MSPERFVRFTYANLALLWLIIPSGALVRLTDSGLGCPDWPLCDGGVVPATSTHALIEYTNRLFSGVVLAFAVVTWLMSRRAAPRGAAVRRFAGACALMTVSQAPLGGLTVLSDLHPLMVSSHFVLSLAALAMGTLLVLHAHDRVNAAVRSWCRRRGPLAGLGALALLAAIVTGVLVTAAGPHSGDPEVIRRFGNLADAAWIHVRAVAVLVVVMLALAVWAWREPPADPRARRFAALTLTALAVQVAIGEYQYRNELPWQVVIAHVAVAGIVWALAIATTFTLARPPRPTADAPGPPTDTDQRRRLATV